MGWLSKLRSRFAAKGAQLSTPQPAGLIHVLLDRSAEFGDRGDAALDLGAYDGPEVETALMEIAADATTDPDLAESCGESLGEIWSRKPTFDPALLSGLAPVTRTLARGILLHRRPEWRELLGQP